MSRRIPTSRRLSMESLEVRCNPSAGAGLPAAPVVDLQLNPTTEVLAEPVSLNAFAGQTIRFRIAAVNNQGQLIVGVDDATIRPLASTGGGIVDLVVDPRNRDAIGSNFKYVEDPTRSSIGGAGQDILLGGDARDTPEQSAHELGHTLGFRHEHTRPTSDAPATGDVNGDGVDDIIVGASINGHVKASDDTRSTIGGATTGSFTLTFNGSSTAVSGRVTSVVVDPSDSTGIDPRNSDLYLGNDDGVYVGGVGRDVLLGGAGRDVLIANTGGDRIYGTFDQQGRVLIGTDGGIWNSPDNDNGHGTHVAGTIGAIGNNGVGLAEGSGGFGYAVLVGGAGQDASSALAGARITKIVIDSHEPSPVYSHPGLESIIDDLARDVAGATVSGARQDY